MWEKAFPIVRSATDPFTGAKKLPCSAAVPQTALVKDLVELDPAGYVKADETGETSLAGLYVAGDVRTKKLRQVVTAVSDGANAATAVAEYLK